VECDGALEYPIGPRVPIMALWLPIIAIRVPIMAFWLPIIAVRVPIMAVQVPIIAIRVPIIAVRVPIIAVQVLIIAIPVVLLRARRRVAHHEEVLKRNVGERGDVRFLQSQRRCGSGEPNPGADAAGVIPVPAPMWAG
jgi:hypothetical protein